MLLKLGENKGSEKFEESRVPVHLLSNQIQYLLHKFLYLCVKKHSTETEYYASFSLTGYTHTRKTASNFIETNNVRRAISKRHEVFGVLNSVSFWSYLLQSGQKPIRLKSNVWILWHSQSVTKLDEMCGTVTSSLKHISREPNNIVNIIGCIMKWNEWEISDGRHSKASS